jgi:ADP-ribose pyrophosphatase YjhB (NUDIX family)
VKEPTVTLNEFKSKLKLINAGGGIVFNANNQLLLIKRKGFWDLPKGKAEPNEKIRTTAIREVEEETGVHVETASEQAMITYHCYKMKGECCIKETHWFEMTTTSVEQHLTPQTEEDIEQVIWAEVSDLPAFKDEMYPMIWSILEAYLIAL